MEPEGSLPHSQAPATCPCPELDNFSPDLSIPLLVRYILVLLFPLRLDIPSGLFHSGLPTKTP
jgi:hypothetical protein